MASDDEATDKADRLKQLIHKRGCIKSQLTRFKKYLTGLDPKKFDISALEFYKSKIDPIWTQFSDIQIEIELLDKASDHEATSTEFELAYLEALTAFEKLMPQQPSTSQAASTVQVNPSAGTQQVKLPQIELPKFSGILEEWYGFHDSFNNVINQNAALSDIEKLHYLKAAVSGGAAEVISSLETTTANYQAAWKLLKDRYENKRLIIRKHVSAILNLQPIGKESLNGLRSIVDGCSKHFRALEALKRPVATWDDILTNIITQKLDAATNKEWENSLKKDDLPTTQELIDFLNKKCNTLEATLKPANAFEFNAKAKTSSHHAAIHSSKLHCHFCKQNHLIYRCDAFKQLNLQERINKIREMKLCVNCLRSNHEARNCVASRCRKCNRAHHTLLHLGDLTNSSDQIPRFGGKSVGAHSSHTGHSQTLLATALVNVIGKDGLTREARILLDSGSQSNFVTAALAKELNLPKENVYLEISGINQSNVTVKHRINATIASRINPSSFNATFLVLDKITENLPQQSVQRSAFCIPRKIILADPSFHRSRQIDMLLGADLFYELLCVGQTKISERLYLQKTRLGWIITGTVHSPALRQPYCLLTTMQLDASLSRFWDIEEVKAKHQYSEQDAQCIEHFEKTFKREATGRFIVQLPLKTSVEGQLGESRSTAVSRFYSLERKLLRQPQLKADYVTFMREYITMKHMKVLDDESAPRNPYYLPHHAVIKETSSTTRLRVVFDASCKTTSDLSLNDVLAVGPTIQQELFSIIVRFRIHKIVLTADIEKMYRQVKLDQSQVHLQRILWREEPNQPLKAYELNTITYGTASAAFLAIKCLDKLAELNENQYPTASAIARRDFYVDDLLTGAETLEEAFTIREEITNMLAEGCFNLRKWASNCKPLLQGLGDEQILQRHSLDKSDTIKTLGLEWNPDDDTLQFNLHTVATKSKITKRLILSDISKIFDPLGLIGPVTITAKILMQQIWQLKLNWDESVPLLIHSKWEQYKRELSIIPQLQIPRRITSLQFYKRTDIHAFSDASEKAYGACIYVATCNDEDEHAVSLLCAKSRVAPLKSISLPRLELCGALLLAQLVNKILEDIHLEIDNVYCWSDSTIVLQWLKAPACTWKTFVGNRVSEIQDLTNKYSWNHVRTFDNPADLISRGIAPQQILNNNLWWHGPAWLSSPKTQWPISNTTQTNDIPEKRASCVTNATTLPKPSIQLQIMSRYESLNRMITIFAYVKRYISNLKNQKNKIKRTDGPLTISELRASEEDLIKAVQIAEFKQEYTILDAGGEVSTKSKIISLTPFLDNGIIRVGGRLQKSKLKYYHKHPAVLPGNHPFTRALILQTHKYSLHAGLQATLAAIRTKYWPLSAKTSIRSIIGKCIDCYQAKPKILETLMGQLPENRITPSRPFSKTGIDYCGPFLIKHGPPRSKQTTKAYVAVFVCFATKAAHIELVSSLTSAAFMAALWRFVARRGMVSDLYSDNGTNFIGAKNELNELFQLLKTSNSKIQQQLAEKQINWHLIPPRAPHFGGLWEAAVKSTKHHLRRVIGDTKLTYEEMATLLTQIEAVLNSRPITPLSSDPNDLDALTPGHFLIGQALTTLPQPNITDVSVNRLSRWQHLEFMRQHFWNRWRLEYLHSLQQRSKWQTKASIQLQPGQLVLIKEDNIPPLHWPKGRIERVFPGKDGIVRTAEVRTNRGVITRATAKLSPLPIEVQL